MRVAGCTDKHESVTLSPVEGYIVPCDEFCEVIAPPVLTCFLPG